MSVEGVELCDSMPGRLEVVWRSSWLVEGFRGPGRYDEEEELWECATRKKSG